MSANICRCGTPTVDHAYTCDGCLNLLANALDTDDMTWLDEQLDVSLTRQRGAGTTGASSSSGETGLPWNEWASRARRNLRTTLARWVLRCTELKVRHSSPTDEVPDNTLTSMAHWLLWRVDGLAWHHEGHQAKTEITQAVDDAMRCILWKRSSRIFLGKCDSAPICDGDVYADEGADTGTCTACHRSYLVADRRHHMEAELNARLVTAAEFADLSTYLGLDIPRERVRSRVNNWHNRKRVPAAGHDAKGRPRFQYGALRALLDAEISARQAAK